jgi:hypothetical protein
MTIRWTVSLGGSVLALPRDAHSTNNDSKKVLWMFIQRNTHKYKIINILKLNKKLAGIKLLKKTRSKNAIHREDERMFYS